MITFWIFWVIDAIATFVIMYFFIIGLGDGSISSLNIGSWVLLVLVPIGLLIGSYVLKQKGNLLLAKSLSGILAIPCLLYFLFMLILILANPRWN